MYLVSLRLSGEAKSEYLSTLDTALRVLETGLRDERAPQARRNVIAFGRANGWNWNRLNKQQNVFGSIADLVGKVREQYSWFADILDSKKPEQNRAFFDEIEISRKTGLPTTYDLIRLNSLQSEADQRLSEMLTYEQIAANIYGILTEDIIPIPEVGPKIEEFKKHALKRRFFEQIKEQNLSGWNYLEQSLEPRVSKIVSGGTENLYSVSFLRHMQSFGLFEIYSIDLWHNMRGPTIQQTQQGYSVSEEFKASLDFSPDNAMQYILSKIDNSFEDIHPVHISRFIVGPFENEYQTSEHKVFSRLNLSKQLLELDEDFFVLRCNRTYTFAPNHTQTTKGIRQQTHDQNWRDSFLVIPRKLSEVVYRSIQGSQVRIYEV